MSDERVVKILLDADVLIHFVKGDRIQLLTDIFPNRMVLLDRVKEELTIHVNSLVSRNIIYMVTAGDMEVVSFPNKDREVITEYAHLSQTKGKGESACLAYCRFHPHIIASSNLADVKSYCDTHSIAYLTTMDILCLGLKKGAISEKECNEFISKVRAANSKLPNMTISHYRDTVFDHQKYQY